MFEELRFLVSIAEYFTGKTYFWHTGASEFFLLLGMNVYGIDEVTSVFASESSAGPWESVQSFGFPIKILDCPVLADGYREMQHLLGSGSVPFGDDLGSEGRSLTSMSEEVFPG